MSWPSCHVNVMTIMSIMLILHRTKNISKFSSDTRIHTHFAFIVLDLTFSGIRSRQLQGSLWVHRAGPSYQGQPVDSTVEFKGLKLRVNAVFTFLVLSKTSSKYTCHVINFNQIKEIYLTLECSSPQPWTWFIMLSLLSGENGVFRALGVPRRPNKTKNGKNGPNLTRNHCGQFT